MGRPLSAAVGPEGGASTPADAIAAVIHVAFVNADRVEPRALKPAGSAGGSRGVTVWSGLPFTKRRRRPLKSLHELNDL